MDYLDFIADCWSRSFDAAEYLWQCQRHGVLAVDAHTYTQYCSSMYKHMEAYFAAQ